MTEKKNPRDQKPPLFLGRRNPPPQLFWSKNTKLTTKKFNFQASFWRNAGQSPFWQSQTKKKCRFRSNAHQNQIGGISIKNVPFIFLCSWGRILNKKLSFPRCYFFSFCPFFRFLFFVLYFCFWSLFPFFLWLYPEKFCFFAFFFFLSIFHLFEILDRWII